MYSDVEGVFLQDRFWIYCGEKAQERVPKVTVQDWPALAVSAAFEFLGDGAICPVESK